MLGKLFLRSFIRRNPTSFLKRCLCTAASVKRTSIEDLDMGQATPMTHPHLFQHGSECTPFITHAEYRTRRVNLMKHLSKARATKVFDHHLVILSANDLKIMSNDIPYFFHQDTDFLYFTGLNEPDAIAVLELSVDSPEATKFLLFVQPKDPKRELWDGSVVGEQAAVDFFHADEAFPLKSFHSIISQRYGDSKSCIWVKRGKDVNRKTSGEIVKTIESNRFKRCSIEDVRRYTQYMRLFKSMAEIRLMRNSTSIAAQAFTEVMKHTKPGLTENQLFARLEYHCRDLGAQHLSFPPVVAGGWRANTLHYIKNDQLLQDGEMVLMDGGCVYHGYASDVTRTWPVNGRFSRPQAKLYQIVLDVLKECILECVERESLNGVHTTMLRLLGQELQKLGFIDPKLSGHHELQRAAARFCPHHVGHYLGMDTHDCQLMHRGMDFESGMVITVEPGLYIPLDAYDIPKEYRGIGIRIEDDVLITADGPVVLTNELCKEIDDIETLLAS